MFYIFIMDTSLIVLGSLFIFVYFIRTSFDALEITYNILCDINDRTKEEEDKNKIPESVKHLYS